VAGGAVAGGAVPGGAVPGGAVPGAATAAGAGTATGSIPAWSCAMPPSCYRQFLLSRQLSWSADSPALLSAFVINRLLLL
jgi:hypothetical protein